MTCNLDATDQATQCPYPLSDISLFISRSFSESLCVYVCVCVCVCVNARARARLHARTNACEIPKQLDLAAQLLLMLGSHNKHRPLCLAGHACLEQQNTVMNAVIPLALQIPTGLSSKNPRFSWMWHNLPNHMLQIHSVSHRQLKDSHAMANMIYPCLT
jgi:hypothetical protein